MLAKCQDNSILFTLIWIYVMGNMEQITGGELPTTAAVELMLEAVNRASFRSTDSGHFRVAGGDAAGTINVDRNPVVVTDDGRAHETHNFIRACVGPEDEDIDTSFWEEQTVIDLNFSNKPALSFHKGKKEWVYGSGKPPKKFVLKALTRLGLDSL